MTPRGEALARDGFLWLRNALSEDDLRALEHALPKVRAGKRLSTGPTLAKVIGRGGPIAAKLTPILEGAFATRAVLFDKSTEQNWGVPWHQDRIVAVQERYDVDGFGAWSRKSGVWHCEPPAHILGSMLFLRIHLDDETKASGPLEIAPGSHRRGMIASSDASAVAEDLGSTVQLGQRGDILILNMLTLHRSQPAVEPMPRRVLRVDYANSALPAPLAWAEAA